MLHDNTPGRRHHTTMATHHLCHIHHICRLPLLEPINGEVSVIVLCHAHELAFQIKNEYMRFAKYMSDTHTGTSYGTTPILRTHRCFVTIYYLRPSPPHHHGHPPPLSYSPYLLAAAAGRSTPCLAHSQHPLASLRCIGHLVKVRQQSNHLFPLFEHGG
jgi:hypothetical protein